MRKFSYKKQQSVIRTLKEPKIKKKKWNTDRVLYFIIIAIGFFFLAFYLFKKVAWIKGSGMVMMHKVDVNFTDDIRVKNLLVKDGDTVCVNQALFTYINNGFEDNAALHFKGINNIQSHLDDLLRYEQQIALKKNNARNLSRQLKLVEQQVTSLTRLVLLDASPRTKLTEMQQSKVQLQSQLQLLWGEIKLLEQFKKQLGTPNEASVFGGRGGQASQSKYNSPINGIVGQIFKTSEEACYKTETVMTIHNPDEVYINAYFKLEDLSFIKKGGIVTVKFPDHSTSKGYIETLYIATYEAPSEFQKKYEPTERNILVKITPLDNKDIILWRNFYKLEVELRVEKY